MGGYFDDGSTRESQMALKNSNFLASSVVQAAYGDDANGESV